MKHSPRCLSFDPVQTAASHHQSPCRSRRAAWHLATGRCCKHQTDGRRCDAEMRSRSDRETCTVHLGERERLLCPREPLPPIPSLATGEPGGRMSCMPSNVGVLMTLMVQPALRLRRCTVADRLRSCVCSSNSSEACTWSSVSASACRASRERSRWSKVEFRPELCSLWQEREGGIREVWKCDRLTVLTSEKRPTPAQSQKAGGT